MQDNSDSLAKTKAQLLSIGEASEYLGVSIDTVRRWEKKGKIATYRSPGGHRYFQKNDLDSVFGKKYERAAETKPRNILAKKASPIAPEEDVKKKETILDRPVRDIKIPESASIRIRKEEVISYDAYVETKVESDHIAESNSSVLTPEIQAKPVETIKGTGSQLPKPVSQNTIADNKTTLIVITILGVFILGIIIFILWNHSQRILSPVP